MNGCRTSTNAQEAWPKKQTEDFSGFPVTVTTYDSQGQERKLVFRQPPQRVIAVWQNSVETLLDLGVGDKIIAANGLPDKKYLKKSLWAAYDKIPVRMFKPYDLETAIMAEPDFILGWYSTFTPKVMGTTGFWDRRGINTYIAQASVGKLSHRVIADEYKYILDLGTIFGVRARAVKIVDGMQRQIDYIVEATGNKPKTKTLIIEFMGKNITTYGKETLAGDIVQKVNGEIIPTERNISWEDLVTADPEALFIVLTESKYGDESTYINKIMNNKALQSLRCVRNKRVYTLPLYSIYAAAVRMEDGIDIIGNGLHPELKESKNKWINLK